MTTDWRDIPMTGIRWNSMKTELGRSRHVLRRLSIGYSAGDAPKPYAAGAWKKMTLGEVADMGRRELLRHNGMGDTSLSALQQLIDLAAAGRCPVAGAPAPDALTPNKITDDTGEREARDNG